MNDTEPIIRLFQSKSQREVARDYFIYYVMQHELCLSVENSKRYVLVPSWLAKNGQGDSYRQSLQAMTTWYWENFSVLADDQVLTFDSLYLYVPVFLNYLGEAQKLWKKLHAGNELPAYDEKAEFWGNLIAILKQHSKHQHLILPYLQWRYGNRTIKNFPRHNLPPNPFTEERFVFHKRRDKPSDRRPSPPKDSGRRSTEQRGLTDEMQAEINSAISLLKKDRQQKEVTLKPTNSFYRRLQHKVIAGLGFGSRSLNIGNNERAVRIVRKSKKRQ